mgnify:CR=1 FL=1
MQTLFVIIGPTGVGKTETCLQVAEHLNTPIVNADSRQIFKEIPIGTAAPPNKDSGCGIISLVHIALPITIAQQCMRQT